MGVHHGSSSSPFLHLPKSLQGQARRTSHTHRPPWARSPWPCHSRLDHRQARDTVLVWSWGSEHPQADPEGAELAHGHRGAETPRVQRAERGEERETATETERGGERQRQRGRGCRGSPQLSDPVPVPYQAWLRFPSLGSRRFPFMLPVNSLLPLTFVCICFS